MYSWADNLGSSHGLADYFLQRNVPSCLPWQQSGSALHPSDTEPGPDGDVETCSTKPPGQNKSDSQTKRARCESFSEPQEPIPRMCLSNLFPLLHCSLRVFFPVLSVWVLFLCCFCRALPNVLCFGSLHFFFFFWGGGTGRCKTSFRYHRAWKKVWAQCHPRPCRRCPRPRPAHEWKRGSEPNSPETYLAPVKLARPE